MIRTRLSVMMFLEFFIWGAWLPLIFAYLPERGFSSTEQSWILNTFAIASFVGMFFSNQFADRNFAAEKFLAVSHLIGGLAFLGLYWANNFWSFFALMMVHCLFYVPTISITNSIAFANVEDAQRDFGPVRLWGTIGWIAAAWPYIFFPDRTNMFFFTGAASLALAIFSLFLPHTPPKPAAPGEGSFAWLKAVKYLQVLSIFVLFVVTFIDTAVHQCYFIWTETFLQKIGVAKNYTGTVMSIGQVAEIGTMAVLGMVLKRLGWRTTMIVGILGHFVRFGLFAFVPLQWLAISINVVHGVCYAFFFATVYIFVDEYLPKDVRTSAQGLFNVMILGLGPFVGNLVWPAIGEQTAPAVVEAQVAFDQGSASVKLSGFVRNSASGADRVEIFEELPPPSPGGKADERLVLETPLGPEGKLEATLPDVAAGDHTFFIKTFRRSGLLGDQPSTVNLPLKVPAEAPQEVVKAVGKDFDFQTLFLYPALTALVAAILLAIAFHPPAQGTPETTKAPPAH
jgi:nucleoside transporter